MTFKNIVFLLIFIVSNVCKAQTLNFSHKIQDNKIINYQNQPLILLDFWATWCGPCIPATEQLEINQYGLKDEVYMISVSDEPLDKISSFVAKRNMQLGVYQDVEGQVFQKYDVQSRPYAVLLSNNGKLIWKGHPANLSVEKIKRYANRQSHNNSNLEDVIKVDETELILEKEVTELSIERCELPCSSSLVKTENYVSYQGELSSLIALLHQVSAQQVIVQNKDRYINVKSPIEVWENKKDKIIAEIEEKFEVKVTKDLKEYSYIELKLDQQELLWNKNEINWGQNSGTYLIGTSRIKADNLSVSEIASILSKEKSVLYVYLGKNRNLYDWDFQYTYANLMKEELKDAFGIKLLPLHKGKLQAYIIDNK